MVNYILLADIVINNTSGEYSNIYVEGIYMGNGKFDNDKLALEKAEKKFNKLHEENDNWDSYSEYSRFFIKKIS